MNIKKLEIEKKLISSFVEMKQKDRCQFELSSEKKRHKFISKINNPKSIFVEAYINSISSKVSGLDDLIECVPINRYED